MHDDDLTIPPTALEVADLVLVAEHNLSDEDVNVLRRLAFDRDRLFEESLDLYQVIRRMVTDESEFDGCNNLKGWLRDFPWLARLCIELSDTEEL